MTMTMIIEVAQANVLTHLGPARNSFGPSEASSPEARPRPVAKKTLHQSATSTGWNVDQLAAEDMIEL